MISLVAKKSRRGMITWRIFHELAQANGIEKESSLSLSKKKRGPDGQAF
jgi:hypothetical protein